jgi:hypothetical protein
VDRRVGDLQLRQLRRLRRAYDGRGEGPDLLLFGDSAMYWTGPGDSSRAYLCDSIRKELGPVRCLQLYGPGYTARIFLPFLAALAKCRTKPRAVLVPLSFQMLQATWLADPEVGCGPVADQMTALIESDAKLPRKLEQPSLEQVDEFHRMPSPSVVGATLTVGEFKLMQAVKGRTRSQKRDRLRHNLDYHHAEGVPPGSEGLRLVGEVGAALREMELPSVGYVPPGNYELLTKILSPEMPERLERNADLISAAFLEGTGELGTVVNGMPDGVPEHFYDPIHLNYDGRRRFAARIADALRPLLER